VRLLPRRLYPTFADLLGVFLVALVVLIGSHRLFGDADAATHVATGLWILEHKQVPKTDPFSGTHAGGEWFAHEWLADLGSALAYRAAGWPGLVVASAFLVAAAHVLLYRSLVRHGHDALVSFGAVVAAAAAASSHWLARPHLLTVLFLVVWATTLERVVRGQRPRLCLAALPPLAALWANLHGGFLIAFGVLACYGAGALVAARPWLRGGAVIEPEVARARSLIGPLAATGVATAAAVIVNPWGWRLLKHLLGFFTVHGEALAATTEFQPATIEDRAGLALAVFLAVCLAGLWCGAKTRFSSADDTRGSVQLHPGTVLSFIMGTVMALVSIRHVEVMAVLGVPIAAGGLSTFLRFKLDAPTRLWLESLRRYESGHGGGLLTVVLLGLAGLAAAGRLPHAGFDPASFPVEMVSELNRAGVVPNGPVFAPDVWGGYLILEFTRARVFVDGRWDMYGDDFFVRYADIMLARPRWSQLLREAGVDWAILPLEAPLAAAMRASPEWTPWRADATAVAFRRRITTTPSRMEEPSSPDQPPTARSTSLPRNMFESRMTTRALPVPSEVSTVKSRPS
jgi:hypothetical protein